MQNRFAHLIPGSKQPAQYELPPLEQVVPPQPKQPAARNPDQARGDQLGNRETELRISKLERDMESDRSQPALTKGQESVDTKFADDYVSYTAGGGFADVQKQLRQLQDTSGKLKSGRNLTGPLIGSLPDAVTSFTNPEVVSAREDVEEVAQRALRQILGAQFTEQEGARLIAKTYNPRLPETENRKRVARLRIQLTKAAMAKEAAVRYFEKHGTLKGWNGKLWSFSDFNPEDENGKPTARPSGATGWGIEEID